MAENVRLTPTQIQDVSRVITTDVMILGKGEMGLHHAIVENSKINNRSQGFNADLITKWANMNTKGNQVEVSFILLKYLIQYNVYKINVVSMKSCNQLTDN